MAQTIGNIIDEYDRKESVSVYLREDVEHICQLAQREAFKRAAEVVRHHYDTPSAVAEVVTNLQPE